MNRIFYAAGIFLIGLMMLTGLIDSINFLQIGGAIHYLNSSLTWFLSVQTIYFLGTLFLLYYYYLKKFSVAFLSLAVATIFILWHVLLVFKLLATGEHSSYLTPSFIALLAAGVLYGLGLTFSRSGKRKWLKWAGALTFLLNIFLLAIYIWSLNTADGGILKSIENMHGWAVLTGNLIYVCYLLNFWNEFKKSGTVRDQTKKEKTLQGILTLTGSIALLYILVMVLNITQEAGWHKDWLNTLPEREQKLKQQFEERAYVSNEQDTLQYLLLEPLDYDPKKEYPLVLILPAGGYESDVAHLLSKEIYRKQYPAFLMVPYCPPGEGWGGIPGYPTIDTLVFEAVTALDPEFAIDKDQRYVTGVSRGAYGSWHFISTRPDLFAAAVPISGAGDPKFAQNITDVSVWAFHGSNDRNVPVSGSRDMVKAIKQAGGNPKYTEYPDEAHNISMKALETPGLLDWLFDQKGE